MTLLDPKPRGFRTISQVANGNVEEMERCGECLSRSSICGAEDPRESSWSFPNNEIALRNLHLVERSSIATRLVGVSEVF